MLCSIIAWECSLVLHHEISEILAGMKEVVEQEDGALIGHVFAQCCIQPREGYAGRSPTGAGSVGLRLAAIRLILVLWCNRSMRVLNSLDQSDRKSWHIIWQWTWRAE